MLLRFTKKIGTVLLAFGIFVLLIASNVTADDDFDGLQNGEEIQYGTNSHDSDTDNDGLSDGDELNWNKDSDGDGEFVDNLWYEGKSYNNGINALDWDSDNDGIADGTEAGITDADHATYYNSISDDPRDEMYNYPLIFDENESPDKDGNTTTNPLLNDTDGDGLFDGWQDLNNNNKYDAGEEVGEDINANGKVDPGETDPNKNDTDGGGIDDGIEVMYGTDPLDPNDDSGLLDTDNDNILNRDDKFPEDPNESNDTDGDGVGDNSDDFPEDITQSKDTDGDNYGDNTTGNSPDLFPNDKTEWADTDMDSFGDNSDKFPNDPAASIDSDSDGYPDEWNPGKTEADSTTNLKLDYYPTDAEKWAKEKEKDDSSTPGFEAMLACISVIFVIAWGASKRER